MPQRIDWKYLVQHATEVIAAEQNADYARLRDKLRSPTGGSYGIGTIALLLPKLEKKGVVVHGPGRRWFVAVEKDGTAKAQVPEKRTYRKKRRRKGSSAPEKAPAVRPERAHRPRTASHDGVTLVEQLEYIEKLAGATQGRTARMLGAVAESLEFLQGNQALFDALRD